jgi:hypothetical protein
MGTRGLWGFIIGEEQKLTYNHFDSYPDGLGVDLINAIKDMDYDTLYEDALALQLVTEDVVPTGEQIEQCKQSGSVDLGVGSGEVTDWYCLLRNCQGNLPMTLASGVMIDNHKFAADSLFCEFGYIIDLDTGKFETYRGFQEQPHAEGRFYQMTGSMNDYYPIKLIDVQDLHLLPKSVGEWASEVNKKIYPEGEE